MTFPHTFAPQAGPIPLQYLDDNFNALAASTGSSLVGFIQSGTGAVARTVQDKGRETVSVLDFYANGVSGVAVDPTGVIDSTLGIQAAINYCQITAGSTYVAAANTCTLHIPAGVYKITNTINITGNIRFIGDGNNATIFNVVSATPIQSFLVGPSADNQYMWGSLFKGFRINCNGGAALCDGLKVQTGVTNSVITQTVFDDIMIWQCRTGFELSGVLYMDEWSNCKVVGCSYRGFVGTGTQTAVYNSLRNLEVTQTGSAAFSYYFVDSPFTGAFMSNVTCDGCCIFSIPYGHIDGLTVEGLSAATVPTTTLITINQLAEMSNTAIIAVPTAKCSTGILINAVNTFVHGVRVPGGTDCPNKLIDLAIGSGGVLSNVFNESSAGSKLETYVNAAALPNWKITASPTLTNYDAAPMVLQSLPVSGIGHTGSLVTLPGASGVADVLFFHKKNAANAYNWTRVATDYVEANWTPGFATWAAAPTLVSAAYTRIGRQITVSLVCQGGSCVAGSTITGLPLTSSATVCGTATAHDNGTSTIGFVGSVWLGGTAISSIPATNFGTDYWTMTATYFTDL